MRYNQTVNSSEDSLRTKPQRSAKANMSELDRVLLKRLSAKYIWWKTPDQAMQQPNRIVAQVMNIGDYDDVRELTARVGENYLREVLTHAEIGQFNERSWAYWHYRLGLVPVGHVPPMPQRRVA